MPDIEFSDFASICRGCLSKFNSRTVQHPVDSLYKNCTGIDVREDHRLPTHICLGCYRKVELWRKFQLKCQESENKLVALLAEEDEREQTILHTLENVMEDERDQGNTITILAKREDVKEEEEVEMEEEEIEVLPNTVQTEDEGDELVEEETFHEVEMLVEDYTEEDEEEEEEDSQEEETIIIEREEVGDRSVEKIILNEHFAYFTLQCPLCKEFLNNCHEFNNHLAEAHDKCSICPECPDVEPMEDQEFIRHIYSHVDFKFACPICGSQVASRMTLRSHLKLIHKVDFNHMDFRQCHVCGGFAQGEQELKKHLLEEHVSRSELSCFMCPFFTGQSDRMLAAHLYTHGYSKGRSQFCCEVCGKVVVSQTALINHMRLHKGKNSAHVCDICGNVYKSQAYLDDHKLTHTLERNIECPECHKKFYLLKQLKTHLRTHAPDNRSYICSYCQRGFFNTSTLKEHIRIRHTQERLFPCNLCDRSYYRNRELIEHQRSHTGEKPFSCHICNRIYARKTTLMTHLKTHKT